MRSFDADNNQSVRTPSQFIRVFDGYEPQNLTAALEDDDVNLSWTAPQSQEALMYHHIDGTTVKNLANISWGQKFLPETLAVYEGMAITSVKVYIRSTCLGDYTLKIYKNNLSGSPIYTQQQNMSSGGWQTITLTNPLVVDCTKNLYVTFTAEATHVNPATYVENEISNASSMYYLKESNNTWYYNASRTAAIKTYLSDGTYTYDLYRDGEVVASNLSTTSYSDDASGFGDEYYHKYEVKSVHHGVASKASNPVALSAGATKYFFNDGDWNTADNWTNAAIAGATDAVVIDADAQLGASTLVNALTVNAGKSIAVASGARLDVRGTLTNGDAAGIILEDGAQLNHRTSGVFITYKKNIDAFTRDEGPDGWNLISMPLAYTNTQATGGQRIQGLITEGTEDLFYYDEPTYYWMNYKTSPFGISTKKGYLYANSQDTQIVFSGQTQSASTITINDLSYQGDQLTGFNLIGNPFPCNADVVISYNNTNHYSSDFYVMNADGSELIKSDSHTIAPCQGIFVQASATLPSFMFYKPSFPSAKGDEDTVEPTRSLDITLTMGDKVVDRASIHQGEGMGLDKFFINESSTRISLNKDNRQYASLYDEESDRIDLEMVANKAGRYTLEFDLEGMDYEYMHLVDHLTGIDVDLLANGGRYEFEGKPGDFANRFHLDFVAPTNENVANVSSIYCVDGRLVIPEAGNASSLEIVDMMGRIISSETISGSYDRQLQYAPGVYVVRLNGESVKIVIGQ